MNHSTSPTTTINSRAGVVFAALPVRQRRAVASDRLLVRLARRIYRSSVEAMGVARRPLRTRNDEPTRITLTRDRISIDQGRPRGGGPGNLDGTHYDLLRQFR